MHATQRQDALARELAEDTVSAGRFDELFVDQLSEEGQIDALVASERLVRYAAGLQARVLGSIAARRHGEPVAGLIESEVIAATLWAPDTARNRLFQAEDLATRFPEALEQLHAGRISWLQAAALVELTSHLEPEAARAVQARVLPRMPRQSVATTRKALRRAALAADPQGAAKRHEQQVAARHVELRPEQDGMATLALYAPAQTGAAMMAAIDQHAKHRAAGDERSLDQRRADTLAALVLAPDTVQPSGTTPAPGPGTVQPSGTTLAPGSGAGVAVPAVVYVTVGIDTLLGVSEQPGDLKGYGPIAATQARALAFAEGSVWRRLLTAPDGSLLHADPVTYRPTASVARLVRLRDQKCVFPGCVMPSQRCDLDHIEPFDHQRPEAGGATVPENLQALCRHHHQLKTAGVWSVRREQDGTTVWTSQTGHVYTTQAPTYETA